MASERRKPWRYKGRIVGYRRSGIFYIARTIAGRRVKLSTKMVTLDGANTEYEKFELNPAAYVAPSGRPAFGKRPRRGAWTPPVDPERRAAERGARFERAHRLSPADHAALLLAQGGRCAVCGVPAGETDTGVLDLDHCHATGRIRGLLCGRCNRGIGMFGDAPELLRVAAAYLDRAGNDGYEDSRGYGSWAPGCARANDTPTSRPETRGGPDRSDPPLSQAPQA